MAQCDGSPCQHCQCWWGGGIDLWLQERNLLHLWAAIEITIVIRSYPVCQGQVLNYGYHESPFSTYTGGNNVQIDEQIPQYEQLEM